MNEFIALGFITAFHLAKSLIKLIIKLPFALLFLFYAFLGLVILVVFQVVARITNSLGD